MFSLGIPIPMRSYGAVRCVATTLLPIVTRVPFQWLYPTGEKQDKTEPKYQKYYKWADVIAGDYLSSSARCPTVESGMLEGKVIITNTVTAEDTQMHDRPQGQDARDLDARNTTAATTRPTSSRAC